MRKSPNAAEPWLAHGVHLSPNGGRLSCSPFLSPCGDAATAEHGRVRPACAARARSGARSGVERYPRPRKGGCACSRRCGAGSRRWHDPTNRAKIAMTICGGFSMSQGSFSDAAWVYQDSGQVKKHGTAKASWYVGWRDPLGRRHGKSCGPGLDGYEKAHALRQEVSRSLSIGMYSDPSGIEPVTITGISNEEVRRLEGIKVIYFVEAVGLDRVKIGHTDNLSRRLRTLRGNCPVSLKVLAVIRGSRQEETVLHRRFAAARVHCEWFQLTFALKKAIVGMRSLNELDWRTKTPYMVEMGDESP